MSKRTEAVERPSWTEEMCSCGHKRGHHTSSVGGLALGHGECRLCKCKKYTWVVTKGA